MRQSNEHGINNLKNLSAVLLMNYSCSINCEKIVNQFKNENKDMISKWNMRHPQNVKTIKRRKKINQIPSESALQRLSAGTKDHNEAWKPMRELACIQHFSCERMLSLIFPHSLAVNEELSNPLTFSLSIAALSGKGQGEMGESVSLNG